MGCADRRRGLQPSHEPFHDHLRDSRIQQVTGGARHLGYSGRRAAKSSVRLISRPNLIAVERAGSGSARRLSTGQALFSAIPRRLGTAGAVSGERAGARISTSRSNGASRVIRNAQHGLPGRPGDRPILPEAPPLLRFVKLIDGAVPEELDLQLLLDDYAVPRTPQIHKWLLRLQRFS
jgi:hypothetical protein